MSRVLLLDSSFAARPIHDWLLEQGCEVWVMGNRPLDLLAQRDPGHYINDNYASVEAVQGHVDRLGIEYVVPGCTDLSIETALRLKRTRGRMDSPETYHRLADKAAFRALCVELDLPAPRRIEVEQLPVPGKVIAKPSDAFSGRGISVADGADRAAAERALQAARAESRNGEAFLETYVAGQLHSYSVFLEDGKVAAAVFVREDGSVTPYAVDISHAVTDFPAQGEAILRDAIERMAGALQLVDGLLHVQFIWDGERPWLIELSRRCPGDLYPYLVELSTGLRHAAHYASHFIGRPFPYATAKSRHVLRHTVTAGHDSFEFMRFVAPVPLLEFHALAVTGREAPPRDRIDRVGLMFMEYSTRLELVAAHEQFLARSTCTTRIIPPAM